MIDALLKEYQAKLDSRFDIILSENVFSESNFALTLNNEDCHIVSADSTLNNIIIDKNVKPIQIRWNHPKGDGRRSERRSVIK